MIKNKQIPNPHVAYHDGPPEITFFGMDWQRGVSREVTHEQWAAMQLRGDFKEFDFLVVVQQAPAAAAKPETGE